LDVKKSPNKSGWPVTPRKKRGFWRSKNGGFVETVLRGWSVQKGQRGRARGKKHKKNGPKHPGGGTTAGQKSCPKFLTRGVPNDKHIRRAGHNRLRW